MIDRFTAVGSLYWPAAGPKSVGNDVTSAQSWPSDGPI